MGIIQDELVKRAIKKIIQKSNEKLDFNEVITTHGSASDVNKKLVIRIIDMNSVTGLGIIDGKMVEIEKVGNPDTVFTMTKNVFSNIILNKIESEQAYFMGAIEADGNNWIRDSLLLSRIFKEIKKVLWGTK